MATAKTTSDKTFYREEDQEITSVRHRSLMNDELNDVSRFIQEAGVELIGDKKWDDLTKHLSKLGNKVTSHRSEVRTRDPIRGRSCSTKWKVVLVLLLLAALTAGFYYVYVMGDSQPQ